MHIGYKADFIKQNDEIIGINFGAACCAEQGCGIAPLKQAFGVGSDNIATVIPSLFIHRGILQSNKTHTYYLVLYDAYKTIEDWQAIQLFSGI